MSWLNSQALENAIRQIYTAAQSYEQQPEESAVEFLQNVQRLCDASLRGNNIMPQLYVPIGEPKSEPWTGRDAVLRMRDDFLQYVAAANEIGDYEGATHAQRIAVALNRFEDGNIITNIDWPARAVVDERGDAFGKQIATVGYS